jgi:glutamine synthetase
LERVGEEFGVDIDYEPKPIKGDWNGSGGHCNFSTVQSRGEGGYEFIKQNYIPALDKTHRDILELYGANNRQRLTGKHETSSFEKFSWGDGSRAGSVRIPAITKHSGKG